MAAFASCRRSGWVRVLVVILCAFFIFSTLGAPAAQALGVESVAVFGLASVLSAATAALGFKLASNEQGQATLQKMVQDFKTVAWATGFILVGSKLNGLQNGMDYIKMQVANGKTYLDSRVFAWVQQWLAQNGVYDSDFGYQAPDYSSVSSLSFSGSSFSAVMSQISDSTAVLAFNTLYAHFNLSLDGKYVFYRYRSGAAYIDVYNKVPSGTYNVLNNGDLYWATLLSDSSFDWSTHRYVIHFSTSGGDLANITYEDFSSSLENNAFLQWGYWNTSNVKYGISNFGDISAKGNDTGLSGTDTLGKDVIDLTLDQILERLKEWAQDWYDAGADSATNAATGAKDLPLTVATGAATANPSIAEDGPLVWFPSFGLPIPSLRTGETDTKTVDQGKENASAVETSTVDVAENQSVIDSLVNWALNYISPDTGLFSKFPLCVPYDAYLLVTSSLGVDAVGSDSIFGASPGDLDGVVNQDIETYSDFQPIINIKHDFQLDGVTYPIELTIDLTPWQPLVTFFREGMALLLVAELIGAEFKRIRGIK